MSQYPRCRAALALFAAIHLAPARADDAVPPPVREELARQGLDIAALSYRIEPLGGTLAPRALAASRIVNPASGMKLVTSLAALYTLGPAHRWTTAMLAEARPENGELKGNLYLRGGGDPSLGWERLGGMLRALRNSGIVIIGGDLVLDRSLFQPARTDIGAAPFDDTPDAWYNVIPDALAVSDYLISYSLSSDAANVVVQTTPPLAGVTVVNGLVPDDRPCAQWRDGWRRPDVRREAGGTVRIVLGGAFPRNCKVAVELATLERDLYLERLVRALWEELGGQWRGRAREGRTPAHAIVLAERQFDTLAETLRPVNKDSHAVKARMVYLMLGTLPDADTANSGMPTQERARRRVLGWLAGRGIDTAGMVIDNGAGLSRVERLSAQQLSSLLKRMAGQRWHPEFAATLPIVALDGTMRRRLTGSVAAGEARLKTGTLRDVAALAGYVRDVHGQEWAMAAFINDPQADKGRAVLDRLVDWLASGGAHGQ